MELDDLTITTAAGESRDGLVIGAVTAQVRHTIVGASTLTVFIPDDDGQVLTSSPPLATAARSFAAGRAGHLVAVHQVASVVRLVFEDAIIAALRSHRDPMMFATALQAGDIITRFGTEAGILVDVDPVIGQRYVEGVGRSQLEQTDSWREISTIVTRLGGRTFSDGSRLVAATDTTLLAREPVVTVAGNVEPLQSAIDFTIDVAQPLERATFSVDTEAWTADAGAVVEVIDSGPADGMWLVSEWTRFLPISGASRVRLTRPLTIGG